MMNTRLAACAAALVLGGTTAGAQLDLAYLPEYEEQFRVACGTRWNAADCQCALERLQHAAGYAAFAEAIRDEGGRALDGRHGAAVRTGLAECAGRNAVPDRAAGTAQPVDHQPPGASPALAAVQDLCRAREGAMAPRIRLLVERPDPRGIAELRAAVGNIVRAREFCAAGDVGRALATYDHVAAFLDAGGFGDELAAP